jgi:hypothetical protein
VGIEADADGQASTPLANLRHDAAAPDHASRERQGLIRTDEIEHDCGFGLEPLGLCGLGATERAGDRELPRVAVDRYDARRGEEAEVLKGELPEAADPDHHGAVAFGEARGDTAHGA